MYPHLGKANTEYAKSVKPMHSQLAAPPDPGVLFDGPALLMSPNLSPSCPKAVQAASFKD